MNFPCRVHTVLMDQQQRRQRRDHRFETATRARQIDRLVQRVFHFHARRRIYRAATFIYPPSPTTRREFTARHPLDHHPSPPSSPPFISPFDVFRKTWNRNPETPTRLSSADKYYSPRIFDSMNAVARRRRRRRGAKNRDSPYFYLATDDDVFPRNIERERERERESFLPALLSPRSYPGKKKRKKEEERKRRIEDPTNRRDVSAVKSQLDRSSNRPC